MNNHLRNFLCASGILLWIHGVGYTMIALEQREPEHTARPSSTIVAVHPLASSTALATETPRIRAIKTPGSSSLLDCCNEELKRIEWDITRLFTAELGVQGQYDKSLIGDLLVRDYMLYSLQSGYLSEQLISQGTISAIIPDHEGLSYLVRSGNTLERSAYELFIKELLGPRAQAPYSFSETEYQILPVATMGATLPEANCRLTPDMGLGLIRSLPKALGEQRRYLIDAAENPFSLGNGRNPCIYSLIPADDDAGNLIGFMLRQDYIIDITEPKNNARLNELMVEEMERQQAPMQTPFEQRAHYAPTPPHVSNSGI